MKQLKIAIILSFLLLISACKTEKKELITKETNTLIKHAKGFDIQIFNTYIKLIIKSPYPDAKEVLEYILIPKGNNVPSEIKGLKVIRIPIKRLVVTSTTHIPMLELLNEENSLVGFPNLQYISSSKTRKLIANGNIKELGNEQDINTEVLLDLQPEIVIGFSMSSNNKVFSNIEKAGIQVLLNGDWLEETPLGRAEWIKFFGVLFGKEKQADSIFNEIKKQYKEAKIIAKKAKTKPTVLSGALFKDIWNLPAGESFVAQFLKDANTNYLWADTKGKGSLSLSFESVFEKGQYAEFWIAPGHYTSSEQLKNANQHYTEFNAFKNKNIYSFANKKGENGGVLYYELAPVQPHIVLKDIIKVVHPDLLPEYEPFFLEKLN
ncbi:MAG: ABC transporter substrate-binding protein [Flavobacteriaceae bacterium]|nr:ABC transporter substrate-binding protein [Flavobacteriaceae bacterium]